MANKKALILHAWYSKPESNWYPWLKRKLQEKKYQVFIPKIPTFEQDYPNLKTVLDFIDNDFVIDSETIIFGHSLGCLVAQRLAEKHKFKKMILVAGWDFDDLTEGHKSFWLNKIDHDLIKNNVKEIYCISSDNDPYFTAFNAEEMSKRLGGKFILIKHGGHFTSKEKCKQIPQLLSLF
jgi:hypothetical protein